MDIEPSVAYTHDMQCTINGVAHPITSIHAHLVLHGDSVIFNVNVVYSGTPDVPPKTIAYKQVPLCSCKRAKSQEHLLAELSGLLSDVMDKLI